MPDQDSMNQKIAKLLALAERAGTEEEAKNAREKAERLMLKWGISEAQANATAKTKESIVTKPVHFDKLFLKARVSVGSSVVRGMGNMRTYMTTNRLDKSGTLWIMGFESDVNRAISLVSSVLVQADQAQARWWKEQRRAGAHKLYTQAEQFRMRRQFLFSYGSEVGRRLQEMRADEEKAAESTTVGTAIVLRNRQVEVDEQFNKLHLRAGRSVKGGGFGASAAGQAAGRQARLGGKSIGDGPRGALGR